MRLFAKSYGLALLVAVTVFTSCKKTSDLPLSIIQQEPARPLSISADAGLRPYKFERINSHNFYSQGWKEQQVNISGTTTTFSNLSDHVEVVCGPENNSDQRLIQGSVTMNLPTSSDPTLRRIRLRKGGYSGTYLRDLTELKYSTYVVHNAATIMVLQIDVNGDQAKDFNIYFEPRPESQGTGFQPINLNTWQQWNALAGIWHTEASTINPIQTSWTIEQVVTLYPNARIIDTEPVGHNGEGVRFTIGGSPRSLYDNTVGYFDALIIGTATQQHSTLYDFTCSQGNQLANEF